MAFWSSSPAGIWSGAFPVTFQHHFNVQGSALEYHLKGESVTPPLQKSWNITLDNMRSLNIIFFLKLNF